VRDGGGAAGRRSRSRQWSRGPQDRGAHEREIARRWRSPSARSSKRSRRRSTARRRSGLDIMDRASCSRRRLAASGLDERLREETQMPAHLAESPLTAWPSAQVARWRVRGDPSLEPQLRAVAGGVSALSGGVTRHTEFRRPRVPSLCPLRKVAIRVRQDGQASTSSAPAARRGLPTLLTAYFGEAPGGACTACSAASYDHSATQTGANKALMPVPTCSAGGRHGARPKPAQPTAQAGRATCAPNDRRPV